MTTYITTIGSSIYFPSEESYLANKTKSNILILHELTHVLDFDNRFFMLSYLLPQLLFLFVFLTPLSYWFLLSFIFLLPIPAYFRALAEKRAYTITMYVTHKYYKENNLIYNPSHNIDFIVSQFTSSYYYFMWPFKTNITNFFTNISNEIEKGNKPYVDSYIYSLVDKEYSKIFSTS